MTAIYIGSLDDSVYRHPWSGIARVEFQDVIVRQILTSDPISINDGYLFQSEWALSDIQHDDESLLLSLAERGFLTVLCRTSNFGEMPERMAGIVETHGDLSRRSDFRYIKESAHQFGSAILARRGYASWPSIDIGYGFYLLCVAAYRTIKESAPMEVFGLEGALRPMVVSALSALIHAFHEKPVSIRGRLESEIIPRIVEEYRCRVDVASQFRSTLMGLANEFYHINFAALLSAQSPEERRVGVETRSGLLFRGMLDKGVLPLMARKESSVAGLRIPSKIGRSRFKAMMDFVTPGKAACDVKQEFLMNEKSVFDGDETALARRQHVVDELNRAIDITLNGKHDEPYERNLNLGLEFVADNSAAAISAAENFSKLIGHEFETGGSADQALEYLLTSFEIGVPSVVRRIGAVLSPSPSVRPQPRAKIEALLNIGMRVESCIAFRKTTQGAIDRFGTRFAIESPELEPLR